MTLEPKEERGVVILSVKDKRIDVQNSARLKNKIKELADTGKPVVLLDLCKVAYVDSSGLGAIVSASKNMPEGSRLAISGAKHPVGTLLSMTRIDRIIPVYTGTKSALDDLGNPEPEKSL